MARLPEGRPGQMLALALTLILAAVIWLGVVSPLLGWYAERNETLAQQRLLARRMTALVETLPALRGQAEQAGSAPPPDALLAGNSDGVAGAILQQRVQEMAGGFGIGFSSVETLPPEQEGRYRRIRLKLALSAPWPVLVRLLTDIRQVKPDMLIDNLALEASQTPVRADDLPLNASFTILGFRGDAATAAGQ